MKKLVICATVFVVLSSSAALAEEVPVPAPMTVTVTAPTPQLTKAEILLMFMQDVNPMELSVLTEAEMKEIRGCKKSSSIRQNTPIMMPHVSKQNKHSRPCMLGRP